VLILGENNFVKQRIAEATRALRHRDFRIFFFGMLISFIGTWMQSVAQSWLVYRLSRSALLLGLIGFAGQAPVFFLSPLGGVFADRYRRHRIILVTQTVAMIQALLLAALTLSGHITVRAIFMLALLLGVVNAFDMPARQSFIIKLVSKQDLMNAIALNSSMVNGARLLGPALAGLVVAWLGEGPCFLINAISYLAVVGGLLVMRARNDKVRQPASSPISDLIEGFSYVRRTRPVRALLAMVALTSVCGLSYVVLMPIFADKILGGGPRTLGSLLGAAGAGSLCAALTLAIRRRIQGLGRVVGISVATSGVMLIAFSLSRNLFLSAAILVVVGYTLMLQTSGSNTLLQSMVSDDMRGRVMSFYSMGLIGMAPFGSLLSGAVAARIGAPATVALGGSLVLVGATLFLVRLPSLRREAIPILIAQGALAGEPTEAHTAETSADGF
jgi:MFS family permease